VIGNLLQPELVELIQKRDFTQLREILCNFPVPDIAEIFTDLSPSDEAVLLRILPRDIAAQVFEYLSLQDQEQVLQALGNEQVAQILNDIAPDDRTAFSKNCPRLSRRSCSTCFRLRNVRLRPNCSAIRKIRSDGG